MRKRFVYIAGVLVLLALLILRVEVLLWQEGQDTLANFVDTIANVSGVVADDPDMRDTAARVTLDVGSIDGVPVRGKLLVSLPPTLHVAYGDTLVVRGKIQLPQNFTTNTGREFNYQNYLHVRGVSATMSFAKLIDQTPSGWSLSRILFDIKHAFERSLERAMPSPQVSLLEGILLGERGGFSTALLQLFVVVGLIHVIVLSGNNIAVVSEGVLRILGSFLSRRATLVVGFIAIVLFALMVGGGAATVRAVIMGGIAILARYLRRPASAMRALAIAGAGLVLWNPLYILDQGFVLSMLATFGLITMSPKIEMRLDKIPAWQHFNLRSIIATTIAVEIFILPALLYYSGVFSLVSVPANALLLPLIPLIMFLGFVAGLAGLIHPLLALIPALGADVLLRLVLLVVSVVGSLPFAAVVIPPFAIWIVLFAYVPLTLVALRAYKTTLVASSTKRQSAFR